MTPFEPLPPPRPPRPSRARRALEIAWGLIVALVLLSAAGGVAYVLATGQTRAAQAELRRVRLRACADARAARGSRIWRASSRDFGASASGCYLEEQSYDEQSYDGQDVFIAA
jgi:hypothetical protein